MRFRSATRKSFPVIIALLTSTLVIWMWSAHDFIPRISDERAYLFQAEIFAHGRWTAPGRPMPEFFEQEHIFVTPVSAAKYPPGHSLILVPGMWLGWPPLIPVLLAALGAALLFMLARDLAGESAAFLTWAMWITMPLNLDVLPSYFSETTTTVAWLLGWFALSRRYRGARGTWVLVTMACIGWIMITRPLTGVAYAIPTGIITLIVEYRKRQWRYLLGGTLILIAIGSIIPIWSYATIGSATTTPYQEWSRIYTPYDKPGFGFDSTAPVRSFPPDLSNDYEQFRKLHTEFVADQLPTIVLNRLHDIKEAVWPGRRIIFLVPLILGLIFLPRAALVAALTCLSLFCAYLAFAHPRQWQLYYTEMSAGLAFIAAVGVAGSARLVTERITRDQTRASALTAIAAVLVIVGNVELIRPYRMPGRWHYEWMRGLIAEIPTPKNLVFVRYPPGERTPILMVANGPFLDREKNVVVFDRGFNEDRRLAAIFPNRQPYLMTISTTRNVTVAKAPQLSSR